VVVLRPDGSIRTLGSTLGRALGGAAGVAALALLLAAGCGKDQHYDDAAVQDAGQIDGGVIIDAGFDARTSANAIELTGGAGSLHGAIYNMEVQVGHTFDQAPTSGGGTTAEGNAAVKP